MAPTTLQQLLDRAAIEELKARYCRHLDRQDWDGLRAVFTDDLVIDVGTLSCRGADEYVAMVRERTVGAVTVHQCSMPELDVDEDTATGTWAMTDRVQRGPAAVAADGIASFHGFGYYHEEYRRTADGWRSPRCAWSGCASR